MVYFSECEETLAVNGPMTEQIAQNLENHHNCHCNEPNLLRIGLRVIIEPIVDQYYVNRDKRADIAVK